MSTASSKNINPRNDINLVFKIGENVVLCKTINNTEYNFKNLSEIEEYLETDCDLKNRNLHVRKLELDSNYLIPIIAEYSQLYNKGIIDWNYNYNEISFIRLKKMYSYMPITVNVSVYPDSGAAGGPGIPDMLLSSIVQIILEKIINFVVKNIIEYFNHEKIYVFFKENYNVDKEYIHKIIKTKHTWRKGFIDRNIYEEKEDFETKIMKDCEYKYNKRAKCWESKNFYR